MCVRDWELIKIVGITFLDGVYREPKTTFFFFHLTDVIQTIFKKYETKLRHIFLFLESFYWFSPSSLVVEKKKTNKTMEREGGKWLFSVSYTKKEIRSTCRIHLRAWALYNKPDDVRRVFFAPVVVSNFIILNIRYICMRVESNG